MTAQSIPPRARIALRPVTVRHSTVRHIANALCALGVCATVARAQSDRTVLRGSTVALYNIVGRMTVESGSGSDVVVEVTRRGRDANRLRIESSEINGRPTLRVIYPDDEIVYTDARESWDRTEMRVSADGTWGNGRGRWNDGRRVRISSRGRGTAAWADIRVTVPAGKNFSAYVGVGELTATGVNGTTSLDNSTGKVTATGMRGSLTIDVGSGGADVRDIDVDRLSIDAGSGGVRLTDVTATSCSIDSGSGGVNGDHALCKDFSIDAGSGGVRLLDVRATKLRVDAGSGSVQLTMRDSPNDVQIESGSGGVTLGLPATLSARVEIDAGSGGVESDFPLRADRVERHHLRGTIGDGKGRIRIETGSGPVRLRRN